MKAQIFFFCDRIAEDSIFYLESDVVPRIGETIAFRFKPKNPEVFSSDAKTEFDMLSLKVFIVKNVVHVYTKKDVFENDHTVNVFLNLV